MTEYNLLHSKIKDFEEGKQLIQQMIFIFL